MEEDNDSESMSTLKMSHTAHPYIYLHDWTGSLRTIKKAAMETTQKQPILWHDVIGDVDCHALCGTVPESEQWLCPPSLHNINTQTLKSCPPEELKKRKNQWSGLQGHSDPSSDVTSCLLFPSSFLQTFSCERVYFWWATHAWAHLL